MDPQLQTLGLQLADTAVRHTAASVGIRISAVKAKKNNQETIAELEQIVNDLQSDRSELVRIAQAYEDELVAQRISNSDIEYISNSFVPALQQIIESAPASEGHDVATAQQVITFLQPLLSVEMVTVLQLVGFNFRKAIGEPLT
jgi:predicted helicase